MESVTPNDTRDDRSQFLGRQVVGKLRRCRGENGQVELSARVLGGAGGSGKGKGERGGRVTDYVSGRLGQRFKLL